jgi:hypothetical protein
MAHELVSSSPSENNYFGNFAGRILAGKATCFPVASRG